MHWSQGEISSPSHHSRFTCPSSHNTRKKTLQRLRQSNTTILPWPTPSTTTRSHPYTHAALDQDWSKMTQRWRQEDKKFPSFSQSRPEVRCLLRSQSWHSNKGWAPLTLSMENVACTIYVKGAEHLVTTNTGKQRIPFQCRQDTWVVSSVPHLTLDNERQARAHTHTHTRGHKGCIQTILC